MSFVLLGLLASFLVHTDAFVPSSFVAARSRGLVVAAGQDVDERATLPKKTPLAPASNRHESPFFCDLLYRDKSLRPPSDSPRENGRSWDAALQLEVARQVVEDAAHDRSVTRRLLMGALHRLEYEATFGARSSTEDIARQMTLLDGQWALVFSDGDTGISQGKDPFGYIKAGTDIDLLIDTSHGTACFRNRLGPSLSGPFTWDPYPTMNCDFDSGHRDAHEMEMDDFFRASCRLTVIALEPGYLAVRYSQDGKDGVLVFCRSAYTESGGSRDVASEAKQGPGKDENSLFKRKMVNVKVEATEGKGKGKADRPELDPDNLMVGGYDSVWEYLEEEALTIYMVLALPALVKAWHHAGADYQHKLLLLSDLADGAMTALRQLLQH